MLSLDGLQFDIISILGNFGTVFVDQSYWQSTIAAKHASAHKGYLLGGLAWYTFPFALATSLGLCGVALLLPITAGEVGSGLVLPAVAVHLLAEFCAVVIATMLFMAITSTVSTGSAEAFAVSSLICYGVGRQYISMSINPNRTGKQVLMIAVVLGVFGLLRGGLGVALNHMGLTLGWVYQFLGNAIGSAVWPLWALLMSPKANAIGAVAGAWIGMILAVTTWLIVCSAEFGEITIDNSGTLNPKLAGHIVALSSSMLIHIGLSMAIPGRAETGSEL